MTFRFLNCCSSGPEDRAGKKHQAPNLCKKQQAPLSTPLLMSLEWPRPSPRVQSSCRRP